MFQVEDYRSLELYTSIQKRKMLEEKLKEKPEVKKPEEKHQIARFKQMNDKKSSKFLP